MVNITHDVDFQIDYHFGIVFRQNERNNEKIIYGNRMIRQCSSLEYFDSLNVESPVNLINLVNCFVIFLFFFFHFGFSPIHSNSKILFFSGFPFCSNHFKLKLDAITCLCGEKCQTVQLISCNYVGLVRNYYL